LSLIKWISSLWCETDSPKKQEEKNDQNEPPNLTELQRFAWGQAISLVDLINESIQISNNSTNPETKVSRLELARAKLDSLELLSAQHPFIKLQRLDGVRKTVAGLAEEYSEAGYYAKTDSSCRDYRQDVLKNIGMTDESLLKGWEFGATLQLRTPLRVLFRDGEKYEGLAEPPVIAQQQWEGDWGRGIKSFKDLGIDLPEFDMKITRSSDVGQIPLDGGEYLKFLIKVRTIVEADSSVEDRRILLRQELRQPEWRDFCARLGGNQNVTEQFFPPFIQTIKGLPKDAIAAMWEAGITTPEQLENSTDANLRAIKGIGPAKLAMIRVACSDAINKTSDFVDNVCR
jgi:hypothetical protein